MKRDTRNDTPSFWGFARNYLHEYMPQARNLSPKTIEAYRISLECFVGYLVDEQSVQRKDIGFEHFERKLLKAWLIWMRETKHYQPKTVGLRLTAIKAFLKFAFQEDLRLVALHEVSKALKVPTAAKKPIEYLQENETAAKSRRNRMLLILLYECAARISEITALTLGDLTLATRRKDLFLPTKKAVGYRLTATGRHTRGYDAPRTPSDRVNDTGVMLPPERHAMAESYAAMNLAKMTKEINNIQRERIRLAAQKTRSQTKID